MDCLVLPYGASGWEQKTRVLEELVASRPGPPFLYDDILILVPSARLRRTYGRLLLDIVRRLYGAASLVQPEIQTLYQFFHRLSLGCGGPSLIDENARLILLEGIVKERLREGFAGSHEVLAPALSAAAADTIEHLAHAGVTPDVLAATIGQTDFADKLQVKLLIDVFGRYRRVLKEKGLTDPAGMLAYLAEQFRPEWLARYRRIIIDGLLQTGEQESRILRTLSAAGKCTWLVDGPSAEAIARAGDFHPLRIVKEFLANAGAGAAHDSASLHPDDALLSQVLFSDTPFAKASRKAKEHPSFHKRINLLSAVNQREEVMLIARDVKATLRAGTPADAVLVTFPSLDEYGPLVEEVFTDYGIPYNRALGRQLSTSPVATGLVSLLAVVQEDFSGPALLRIFSSPFLKFSETPALAPALDRLMREKRITGGRQKWLAAARERAVDGQETNRVADSLSDLFSALEPFSGKDPAALAVWMERLSGLIAWSGLASRVAAVKGPLSMNVQAYRKLSQTLASLGSAGKLFPGYRYTFNEWLFLLKKTFMHARFQVPPEDEGGVQVLGIEENAGHAWNEIFVGGLVDGKFPQRLPQNIFLPEATLEALGVRTLEKARLNAACHFYRLLLSAQKVTLTWPENAGDRPVVPSPFLEELTPLRRAGLVNRGIERTSGLQFNLLIEESRSISELAKAISLAGSVRGFEEVLEADRDGMAALKSACEYRPLPPAAAVTPAAKREFTVTELDRYLRCPYDYYVTQVLGIRPLEEVTEDISPLGRGSTVHAILRDFSLSWNSAVTQENRDEARALLHALADRAFGREADTFRNRREKEFFLFVMAERFLDAEEALAKQDMRPAYLEQEIGSFTLVLPDGTEAAITGKIDRIDVDEKGEFIIVDYKTGNYPAPKMGIEQDIFQLPVYAVMAQAALSGKEPVLRKPIGLAYYDLAGKTGGGARDVVLFNRDARDDHPAARPKASPKSAGEFAAILHQSMDKARKAIEGIRRGDFPAAPQDENRCRFCPNDMMCGKKSP